MLSAKKIKKKEKGPISSDYVIGFIYVFKKTKVIESISGFQISEKRSYDSKEKH